VLYGMIGGFFHHNEWGSQGGGGSIQVSLVSSALPLPNDQPHNDNVLATEKPSQAPAPPAPKEKQAVDDNALAIQGKTQQQKQQQKQIKTPQRQMTPQPTNRAQCGERRLCQPFWLVRGRDQPQDVNQLEQTGGGLADAQRSAGVFDFHDSPRWNSKRCAGGPVEREPDAGPLVCARGAARGHVWGTTSGI